jgi:glycosyltransferase involved in cell wall biosynthesis
MNFEDNHDPLVTVIITSYNQRVYFFDAIKSILDQKLVYFELIVIDDASRLEEFDSREITAYIDKYKNDYLLNYMIIVNPINIGHTASLNLALNRANGLYFTYVNGDDLLPLDSIYNLSKCIDYSNLQIVISGNLLKLGKNGKISKNNKLSKTHYYNLQINLIRDSIIYHSIPFQLPGSLINLSEINAIGLFDPGYFFYEDRPLYMKFLLANKLLFTTTSFDSYIWRDYSGVTKNPEFKSGGLLLDDYLREINWLASQDLIRNTFSLKVAINYHKEKTQLKIRLSECKSNFCKVVLLIINLKTVILFLHFKLTRLIKNLFSL